MSNRVSVRGYVTGKVQGVGFRYFVREQAQTIGVAGYVRNLADGRVEFQVEGERGQVDAMLARIGEGPAWSRVDRVDSEAVDGLSAATAFTIR